ncbi:MAG: hypothetical protein ABIG92_05290 [Candidatus Omnitrophota bacterium]
MKRISIILLMLFLVSGCGLSLEERPAIRIGNIDVSVEEFNRAFESANIAHGGELGKKEFLDTFISRKLVLKEAEKIGLDKDKDFLGDIQLFWEQYLLKRALSSKTKELSLAIDVTDKEVKDYYNEHRDGFLDKELSGVYDNIKWILLKNKQRDAVEDWAGSLKKKAKIKIDYDLLGIK